MHATSADGVSIHFEVEGLGDPPIVFVHGWACDLTYWRAQMDPFSTDHLVAALDLAGHGRSGLGRSAWTMEAFGQDVAAVIRKLDLHDVVLVGHSMGGTVILEAAREVPGRVGLLVAVDTFFDVEQRLGREQVRQFLTPFRSDYRAAVRSYLEDNMFGPQTDPALKEAIVTDMSQAAPDVALGALEYLLTYDTPAALARVRMPIRCINSDKYVTRTELARKHAASFDVVHMSGVGHFLMMEKPEDFNRLLAQWIQHRPTEVERETARGET